MEQQGIISWVMVLGLTLWSGAAHAQQRPLVTEDPETVGAGVVLFEAGIEHNRQERFPLAGLQGNLWSSPVAGVSIGVGSIAEIQIDGGYNKLLVTEKSSATLSSVTNLIGKGDSTSSFQPLVIGTKIRLLSETSGRPAFGLRLATRLPNASNESGLGLDTTDYFASFLLGKTVESVRIVGNVGLGVVGDPTKGYQHNQLLLYGVSISRAIFNALEVVTEINGRHNTKQGAPQLGIENSSLMRFGARYTIGGARIDSAVLVGMRSTDPSIGFTLGFTYVFKAFQAP